MKTTQEKIAVMQAWTKETLQVRSRSLDKETDWIDWNIDQEPEWDWSRADYRICPKNWYSEFTEYQQTIIKAFESGATVERCPKSEVNCWREHELTDFYLNLSNAQKCGHWKDCFKVYDYVVKLKRRPMRSEEFPPFWWFRRSPGKGWSLCTAMSEMVFQVAHSCDNWTFADNWYFADAKETWQWSPDRKEIKSFFVKEV